MPFSPTVRDARSARPRPLPLTWPQRCLRNRPHRQWRRVRPPTFSRPRTDPRPHARLGSVSGRRQHLERPGRAERGRARRSRHHQQRLPVPGGVHPGAAGSVSTTPATLTVTPVVSTIWAGYVVVGTDFTAVSASWVVPTLTCAAGANTRSDQWVGIDGFADATVEQDKAPKLTVSTAPPAIARGGSCSVTPRSNGGGSVPLPYAVFAGDQITASVTLSGATWTLTVTDTTGHWSVATPEADSSPLQAQASAEWVVEGAKPGGAPLSEFAPITFEGATATAGGTVTALSAAPYMAVQMQVGGSTLATPGAVSGNNFTVTNS